MKKALVFLAEGFEEVEAVTPIDFLRRAGIEVTTAGIGGKVIRGAHDIKVTADIELSGLTEKESLLFDAVVFPGGMPGAENIAAEAAVIDLIRLFNSKGKLIAAICASPAVVLFPAGVLKGRRAACYPGFEKRFDSSVKFSLERVVVDGNIVTSRGPGTAAEFSAVLIGLLNSESEAEKIVEGTLQNFTYPA